MPFTIKVDLTSVYHHILRMGERRGAYRVLGGILRERDRLEDISVDGRTILRLILKKLVERPWIGLIRLRIWTVERGNGHFLRPRDPAS